MPFQTVFYDKRNLKILKIEPNRQIYRSKQKETIFPDRKHHDIGVIYLDGDDPIDMANLRVVEQGPFGNRLIFDAAGEIYSLGREIKKYFNICEPAPAVVYEAEGGLGDHLMEAAACLEYKSIHPEKWVGLSVRGEYAEIMSNIKGLDLVSHGLNINQSPKGSVRVSGRTEYMSDPRGFGYGKVSLYGTRLGLKSLQRVAYLEPDPEILQYGRALLSDFKREEYRPLIGIQFRSGSGHGKSWQGEKVAGLVREIYSHTNCEAIIFGRNWEYPRESPLGINFSGERTWFDTYAAALHCSAFVCIDSGILHLARSLKKPYVCLWGGSTPEFILGEHLGSYDIQVDLECKENLCMECPRGLPECMTKIEPDLVLNQLIRLLKEKGLDYVQQQPVKSPDTKSGRNKNHSRGRKKYPTRLSNL